MTNFMIMFTKSAAFTLTYLMTKKIAVILDTKMAVTFELLALIININKIKIK